MEKLRYIATSTFGLEATLKREVERLGGEEITGLDGRIDFTGPMSFIPKFNLWLRSADRLLINFGEFNAYTFDELFEQTKALPWEQWIPIDGNFIVTGKSVKSKLFSVSDCQSIVKKAIVERLKTVYHVDWFEETGPEYKIQVGLLRDKVTMTIDTTGPGLHKRGYRAVSVAAPLKETLAAALIELSYWRKNRILLDPFCGSGTIAIEAAMMAKNIAPGLTRGFVSENWPQIPSELWKEERKKAYAAIDNEIQPEIYGSDIDENAISVAQQNAKLAGVEDCTHFEVRSFADVDLSKDYGVIICNPPYGQRIGESHEVKEIYRTMGQTFQQNNTWSVYVITSDEEFEKLYGRRADKKRKLFNGMIKTDYYQFMGPRPPKPQQ